MSVQTDSVHSIHRFFDQCLDFSTSVKLPAANLESWEHVLAQITGWRFESEMQKLGDRTKLVDRDFARAIYDFANRHWNILTSIEYYHDAMLEQSMSLFRRFGCFRGLYSLKRDLFQDIDITNSTYNWLLDLRAPEQVVALVSAGMLFDTHNENILSALCIQFASDRASLEAVIRYCLLNGGMLHEWTEVGPTLFEQLNTHTLFSLGFEVAQSISIDKLDDLITNIEALSLNHLEAVVQVNGQHKKVRDHLNDLQTLKQQRQAATTQKTA